MTRHDVVVLGLGGMGSAAADHLARRGVRVAGVEQFEPGHARGSSHGDSRIVRQAYFEHPSYVPLLRRSYSLWRELEERAGRTLLTQTGGLNLGLPGSGTVSGALDSARRWDLPHELLSAEEVARRFPTLRLDPEEVAVHEPAAGYARPEATVLAQVDGARSTGADLRFGVRAVGWEADDGGVRVRLDDGSMLEAERLVVTAGAWAPQVLADLDLPLVVERQIMHWFEPADVAPFRDHPVYIREAPDGDQVYGFPPLPGERTLKVAFFRRREPTDPDHVDRDVSAAHVTEMDAAMHALVPGAGRHVRAVTCLYTLTPDHHFVIGPHPAHPSRVVVAAGFSGHGFKFVPLVGEVLADLALDGGTDHDIGLFDPTRFHDSPSPLTSA